MNDTVNRLIPTKIQDFSNVTDVVGGISHTFITTIDSNGSVFLFGAGANQYGQLCQNYTSRMTIAFLPIENSQDVIGVYPGQFETIFLKSTGQVTVCGWNIVR